MKSKKAGVVSTKFIIQMLLILAVAVALFFALSYAFGGWTG